MLKLIEEAPFCIFNYSHLLQSPESTLLQKEQNLNFILHIFPILCLGFLIVPNFSFARFIILSFWMIWQVLPFSQQKLFEYNKGSLVQVTWISISTLLIYNIDVQIALISPLFIFVAPLITMYFTQQRLAAFLTFIIHFFIIKLLFEPRLLETYENIQGLEEIQNLPSWTILLSLIVLSMFFLSQANLSNTKNKFTNLPLIQKEAKRDEFQYKLKKIESELSDLQKSLENKDNSLLTVSHECRNPLNGIQSNLELAETILMDEYKLQGVQVKKLRDFLKNARICGDVLLHYINNLLDTAKIGSNGIDINPTSVDIRATLEKVWAICSESIRKKNLVGTLVLDKRVPQYLYLDSHRLIQVMINLINNAIKFTKRGAITVKIGWKEDDDCGGLSPETKTPKIVRRSSKTVTVMMPSSLKKDEEDSLEHAHSVSNDNFGTRCKTLNFFLLEQKKLQDSRLVLDLEQKHFKVLKTESRQSLKFDDREGELTISITDTGCGISQENIPKLFQKFSQVNNDPSKRKIGTGLGLWLCKHIIEGMKGTIQVKSQEEFGSSFQIHIPTQTCDIGLKSFKSLPFIPSEYPRTPESKKSNEKVKAMVIGNEGYSQKVLTTFLEKCNCEIICETNNEVTAYDCFKTLSGKVELVLIDLETQQSEIGICKALRDLEEKHKLNSALILVVDSKGGQTVRNSQKEIKNNYCDYSLRTPCSLIDIRTAVDQAIYRRTFPNFKHIIKEDNPKKKKILIIDDDCFCLEVAKSFFENAKVETLLASSSCKALEILRSNSEEIGCILVDYEMPEINGKETMLLIREFWAVSGKEPVPIYCCSGNTSFVFQASMKHAGFSDFYCKPLNWRKILTDVRKVLDVNMNNLN